MEINPPLCDDIHIPKVIKKTYKKKIISQTIDIELPVVKKTYKKKILNDTEIIVIPIEKQLTKVKKIKSEDKKQQLVEALEKLRKQEVANKETWKARAYSIIIKELKAFDKPIYSWDDVKGLKGVGKSTEIKIKELLETGKLTQLEDYNVHGHIQIIDELLKIHAIGPSKAKELVEQNNIKSIEDLKMHPELLNDKQKIGLKYWEDFNQRIPRKEMEKHNDYIMNVIKSIDSKIIATLTGSFRRKTKDSGDIDVLLTHPDDPEDFDDLFKQLVEKMKKDYITDILALGGKKCMAVCRMKNYKKFRRLDLLYTRRHEYPFSLLYFTGSGEFNVRMRNIALSKGYSLSEYGLKYSNGDNKGEFIDHVFNDEKDIFKFLNMEYIEPENRK